MSLGCDGMCVGVGEMGKEEEQSGSNLYTGTSTVVMGASAQPLLSFVHIDVISRQTAYGKVRETT